MAIWGLYEGVKGKEKQHRQTGIIYKVQSCFPLVISENSFEHYTRMTQKGLKAFVYQGYS